LAAAELLKRAPWPHRLLPKPPARSHPPQRGPPNSCRSPPNSCRSPPNSRRSPPKLPTNPHPV